MPGRDGWSRAPEPVRCLVTIAAVCVALLAAGGADAGSSRVAVFFYPWYSTVAHDGASGHWNQNKHLPPGDIASAYVPLRGVYSSADTAVLTDQMIEIAATGAGTVVTSWWGTGSVEDQRLGAVIDAATTVGLQVGVQIEPYPRRTVDSVVADITRLRALGIADFYVYEAQAAAPAAAWAAALQNVKAGVRLFAHTSLVGWAATAGFTGIYTYDVLINDGGSFPRLCSQAHAVGLLCAPSVGPGFDARAATGEPRIRRRHHGGTYDAMWRFALRAHADVVTVTSYNEWHEGSQIEPASPTPAPRPSGDQYATFDGAWGLHGTLASWAYIARTALWAERLDPRGVGPRPPVVARILDLWSSLHSPPGSGTSRTH